MPLNSPAIGDLLDMFDFDHAAIGRARDLAQFNPAWLSDGPAGGSQALAGERELTQCAYFAGRSCPEESGAWASAEQSDFCATPGKRIPSPQKRRCRQSTKVVT